MKTFFVLGLCAVVMAGCASPGPSSNVYSASEVGTEKTLRFGTVQSVRVVNIDEKETGVGLGTGAIIGGVAGSEIGKGHGSIVGAVVGAVAGGIAGQAIERKTNEKTGQEITVKLANGEMIVVVQRGEEPLKPGDAVQLTGKGSNVRVTRR